MIVGLINVLFLSLQYRYTQSSSLHQKSKTAWNSSRTHPVVVGRNSISLGSSPTKFICCTRPIWIGNHNLDLMIQEISLHTRHWLWNHEDGRGRQGDQDMLMKLSSGQLLWRLATSMVLSKQVTIKKKVEFYWSVIVFRDYFMRDTKPKPQIASYQSQEKTKKEVHNRNKYKFHHK